MLLPTRCARIARKYLLALPLRDPGFDGSVLCEFWSRLIERRRDCGSRGGCAGPIAQNLFELMSDSEIGLFVV